jgi:hypothetical protein
MDETKLTIRVPRKLLQGAKQYAAANHTTLTRLMSEYLQRLTAQSDYLPDAPIVQRLSGILPPEASLTDYHEYLEEKYGSQDQGLDRP